MIQDVYAEDDASRTAPNWALGRIDQRYLPTTLDFNYYQTGAGVHVYVVDSGIALLTSEFPNRGLSYSEPGLDPWQGCSDHGTEVASVAVGQTQGVAPGATLHSVRVHDSTCELTHWQINAGLDWIAENAEYPAVVNISKSVDPAIFGWPNVDDAVRNLVSRGIVVVVSAGNDTTDACDQSPARVSEAITVAATDSYDNRASFSNYGSCVDLFAPGVAVSAMPRSGFPAPASGTSLSAPMVAGVAALIFSESPSRSRSTVERILFGSRTQAVVYDARSYNNDLVYSLHTYGEVSGPDFADWPGSYTWSVVFLSGGAPGGYTYRWDVSVDGGPWDTVGYGSSYTRVIGTADNHKTLQVRVAITSGVGTYTSEPLTVPVCIQGTDGCDQ